MLIIGQKPVINGILATYVTVHSTMDENIFLNSVHVCKIYRRHLSFKMRCLKILSSSLNTHTCAHHGNGLSVNIIQNNSLFTLQAAKAFLEIWKPITLKVHNHAECMRT